MENNTILQIMYSVFLVDDEHIVLEGIRNKIDWENGSFSFAGEATDGELALSMIHDIKPDILITDIKMPFMDGLDLARTLKKIQPWIKIIILSGHDEFDYAKKAISIGVEEYILKPFTHDELLKSLDKVAKVLDKERKQISDISHLKEELESNTILIKNNFLNDVIKGVLDGSQIIKKAAELNIDFMSHFYKVVVSNLFQRGEGTTAIQETKSRILAYTKSREDIISFFTDNNKFVTILKSASETEIEDECYAVADAFEHLAEQNNDCYVVSTIGKIADHISQISNSFKDADSVFDKQKNWNKSIIINTEDFFQSSSSNTLYLSLHDDDPLVDRLKYAEKKDIDSLIEQQLELLKDNTEQFDVISSYLLVDLIMSVSKLVENLGGNIKEVLPEILQHSFIEKAGKSEESFSTEMRAVLEKILEYRDSKSKSRYGDIIMKARNYIEENYASQDTCLAAVAEEVHLSPNHFSTIFSQECGMTFIEFLTNVRIENAKKLLRETDLKGADIAYECGFSDPHYFSFIFKKTTGMSPRDFKGSR